MRFGCLKNKTYITIYIYNWHKTLAYCILGTNCVVLCGPYWSSVGQLKNLSLLLCCFASIIHLRCTGKNIKTNIKQDTEINFTLMIQCDWSNDMLRRENYPRSNTEGLPYVANISKIEWLGHFKITTSNTVGASNNIVFTKLWNCIVTNYIWLFWRSKTVVDV